MIPRLKKNVKASNNSLFPVETLKLELNIQSGKLKRLRFTLLRKVSGTSRVKKTTPESPTVLAILRCAISVVILRLKELCSMANTCGEAVDTGQCQVISVLNMTILAGLVRVAHDRRQQGAICRVIF